MPNFNQGTDQGSLLSHPVFDDTYTNNLGPYLQTYNGLVRVNTGVYANDETGDSARNAWHKYMQNLDITITKNDCSIEAVGDSVALRNADGELVSQGFIAGDYAMTASNGISGVVSGGRY